MAKPLFIGPEAMCFFSTADGQTDTDPSGSEEGRRAGEAVLEMIREALGKVAEESRVRAVGECFRRFPHETLRHPEVAEYLEHLTRHGNTAALTRILADKPRRGRRARSPEEEFTEVAMVDGIAAREGCSVRQAAEIAKREHPDLFGHKDPRSIENDVSRARDAYRVVQQQHRWIPGSKLTDAPWSPPGSDRGKKR